MDVRYLFQCRRQMTQMGTVLGCLTIIGLKTALLLNLKHARRQIKRVSD